MFSFIFLREIGLRFLKYLYYLIFHSAIMKQISSSSAVRKFVALNLIKLSLLYMEMKNISEVFPQNDFTYSPFLIMFKFDMFS